MFYPPTMLGLTNDRPEPRPVYDIPPVIVRHRPVRALFARHAPLRLRTREACPEPAPESL